MKIRVAILLLTTLAIFTTVIQAQKIKVIVDQDARGPATTDMQSILSKPCRRMAIVLLALPALLGALPAAQAAPPSYRLVLLAAPPGVGPATFGSALNQVGETSNRRALSASRSGSP